MHPKSRELIDRVRSGRLPELVASAWIPDLSPLLGADSDLVTVELLDRLSSFMRSEVYINFYIDKKERKVTLPRSRSLTLFDDTSAADIVDAGNDPWPFKEDPVF